MSFLKVDLSDKNVFNCLLNAVTEDTAVTFQQMCLL